MCLLINHPATAEFSKEDITDFYNHNSDGFGMMWAENNTLYTVKFVGTVGDVWATYQKYGIGRDCAIHFRMKTHGDINKENAHPYTVLTPDEGTPIAMMHNGILSTGNSKDPSRSDTWHYVQDFMRPLLVGNPDFHKHPAFAAVIGAHIGVSSNRFITLDAHGHMNVMNFPNVTYKGAQLSNTYAWSAEKGGYGYKPSYTGFRGASSYSSWYYEDEVETPAAKGTQKDAAVEDVIVPGPMDDYDDMDLWVDAFFEAVDEVSPDLYRVTTWNVSETLYAALGDADAWRLVDAISCGQYTEKDLAEFIKDFTAEARVA